MKRTATAPGQGVAVVAYSQEAVSSLLESGSPDDGIAWILCAPLPPEIVSSESWIVVRYPWPRGKERRGWRSRIEGPVRALRLGRLLGDARVIVAADAEAGPDVRAVGRLYRKPTIGPPFAPDAARAALPEQPRG